MEIISSYNDALYFFEHLSWSIGDIIGGIVIALIGLFLCRIIIRALIQSCFGNKTGTLVAGLAEILISMMLALFSYKNPGVLAVVIGWSAALFRQLVITLRGGW
ncbi:hypothetical protein SAMN05660706_11422 [Desulfoscipio geothermicus DSM 3669]|uniref:Uncharacterized protein n=1 Tax=Desulfoscipio geothermicus DSM 3669 TaxID=1121426 RepID=A0A1I6DNJ4_9FIRM|nr:hypothetical protein SAMN05660706_11422 [Desulfoscipio geothermicus DSM 3669]